MYVYLGITLNFLQLVISRTNMLFIRLLVQLYKIGGRNEFYYIKLRSRKNRVTYDLILSFLCHYILLISLISISRFDRSYKFIIKYKVIRYF